MTFERSQVGQKKLLRNCVGDISEIRMAWSQNSRASLLRTCLNIPDVNRSDAEEAVETCLSTYPTAVTAVDAEVCRSTGEEMVAATDVLRSTVVLVLPVPLPPWHTNRPRM